MYSSFISTIYKIRMLLNSLKRIVCAEKLLLILTQLSGLIVVLTFLKPLIFFGKNLLKKIFGKKQIMHNDDNTHNKLHLNDDSITHKIDENRKYKKLETLTDSCSKCAYSSSSSSSDSSDSKKKCKSTSSEKNKKVKKQKVKISKNKIKKTLRNYNLN